MSEYFPNFKYYSDRHLSLPQLLQELFESRLSPVPIDKGHFCPFNARGQIIRLPLPFGDWSHNQLKFVFDWYGTSGRSAKDSKLVRTAIKTKRPIIISNWQTDNNVQDELRCLWKRNAGIAVPIFFYGRARGVLVVGVNSKLQPEHTRFVASVARGCLVPYIRAEEIRKLENLSQPNVLHLGHFGLLLENVMRASNHYEQGITFETLVHYFLSTIEGVQIVTTRDLRDTGEIDILVLNNSSHPFWRTKSKEVVVECKNLSSPITGEIVRNVYAMASLMGINSSIIFSRMGLTNRGKGSGLRIVAELRKLGFKMIVITLNQIKSIVSGISPSDILQEAEDELAREIYY
jgi:Holliday junction resolvase-like predicted endonuclease